MTILPFEYPSERVTVRHPVGQRQKSFEARFPFLPERLHALKIVAVAQDSAQSNSQNVCQLMEDMPAVRSTRVSYASHRFFNFSIFMPPF